MKITSTLVLSAAVAAASLLPSVSADIYMHMPPGSNNRLNENNRNVQTNARLFDSQNNARGGYLQGSDGQRLKFYAGSQIPIQWANQHSCGGTQDNCDLIIQYMASDATQANNVRALRDGTTTTQTNNNDDANPAVGRHEPRAYYNECKNTVRNGGLFIADQNPGNNNGRTATRQNQNANANGNECAEERDYYPSWVPNPWRDAAVITSDISKCPSIKALSQNVAATYKCTGGRTANKIPNTAAGCTADGGTWTTVPAKGIPAPECILNTMPSRDNSNGLAANRNGTMATYLWTVPLDAIGKEVVLRIRYNVSTGEYYDPATGVPEFKTADGKDAIDRNFNANAANGVTLVPIWEKLKLTKADVQQSINTGNAGAAAAAAAAQQAKGQLTAAVTTRGYVLAANANVDMFGPLLTNGNPITGVGKVRTQIAVNLAQWARTFQDRSHVFDVLDPASNPEVKTALAAGKKVININMMGHRGNAIQVYPAVELQFSQMKYNAAPGDVVHFQWALSKNNPNNNAVNAPEAGGQANANANQNDGIVGAQNGVDQANIVMLESPNYARLNSIEGGNPYQYGAAGRVKPAAFTSTATSFLGLEFAKLKTMATPATAYNSGPITITKEGDFAFMSTASSLANVRTSKAVLSIVGAQYASFKSAAAAKAAELKQLQAALESAPPAGSFQAETQLSAQTPSSANPNNGAAKLIMAQAFEGELKQPKSKSPPIGLIIGVISAIVVLALLIVLACKVYQRRAAAAKTPASAPAYQVKQSAPMAVQRGASHQQFRPAGMGMVQQQQPRQQHTASHLPVQKKSGTSTPNQTWQSDRARLQANYV